MSLLSSMAARKSAAFLSAALAPAVLLAGAARAEELPPGMGQPKDWQLGLQGAATPVMEHITTFHNDLLVPIITVISIFVLALLVIVMVRFNSRANPKPSKTTHHTGLEIAWTVIPILILVVIAIPSFRLLFLEQTIPPADLTLKATGQSWYWDFEYPDNGGITLSSNMVEEKDLKPGQPRLLTVDQEVVVPVNKVVRVQVTSGGVLHAFAMPSFGIKIDAVPGRLNETWFQATREGVYHGQCSELCGARHAFMPIVIRVVSQAEFDAWISTKKAEMSGKSPAKLASNAAPLAN